MTRTWRVLFRMEEEGLIVRDGGMLTLTPKGEAEARKMIVKLNGKPKP